MTDDVPFPKQHPVLLRGILGLISSRNGVMSLIVLGVSSGLCVTGHVDGTSFAAVVATVSVIYQFTRAHYGAS